MVVLSPLRPRSDLLPSAFGRRGEGILRRRARQYGRFPIRIPPQYRGGVDGAHRSQRRRRPHYRFRPSLPAIRPRLPAAATHPDDRAGGGAAAHHASFPPDARLRTGVHPSFRRQQSYPLHPRVDGHPAHHRCAAVLHRERSSFRAHAAAPSRVRRRRALSRRARNHLPRILRPHHRLLDGLVAGSLHFLRLAG